MKKTVKIFLVLTALIQMTSPMAHSEDSDSDCAELKGYVNSIFFGNSRASGMIYENPIKGTEISDEEIQANLANLFRGVAPMSFKKEGKIFPVVEASPRARQELNVSEVNWSTYGDPNSPQTDKKKPLLTIRIMPIFDNGKLEGRSLVVSNNRLFKSDPSVFVPRKTWEPFDVMTVNFLSSKVKYSDDYSVVESTPTIFKFVPILYGRSRSGYAYRFGPIHEIRRVDDSIMEITKGLCDVDLSYGMGRGDLSVRSDPVGASKFYLKAKIQ